MFPVLIESLGMFKLLTGIVVVIGIVQAAPVAGDAVYKQRCASCHEQPSTRAPQVDELRKMSARRILRALDSGAMMTVAYPMSRDERGAVASWLGMGADDAAPPAAAYCKDRSVTVTDGTKFVWNGWSPGTANTRFQSADVAGMTIAQLGRLKLKWAYGFAGDISAFAQPTVIGNQIFVGSASGTIQALHADSGCLEWTFQAEGPVRSAISVAPMGTKHALLFSDLIGWFYAVEAESGHLLWKKKPEPHEATRLTGGALVHDGVVYIPAASWEETRSMNPQYECCTFRGSITALRVRDGSQVWKTYTIPEPKPQGKTAAGTAKFGPSGAGVWATPTLDLKRRVIYVSTGDNYSLPATATSDAIVAMELATGKIVWSKQTTPGDAYTSACQGNKGPNCPEGAGPDHDFGSSALLTQTAAGRDLLLAGQKSGVVYALDPDKKGEIVWQTRVGKGGTIGGVQWGMATDGQNVYAAASDASFYNTAVKRVLDPKQGGGLTALRVADGSKAWFAAPRPCAENADGCSPAQSAALTAIPGVVFSGSMDGHLRAFAAEDGKVLWVFDTAKDFVTVNGVKAKGGAMDGPGPVIVNGMLFVTSGYARYGGASGNVLLAFAASQ
jgi:polyvinyl alcohol dehydrogenase (cytochrome)